MSRIGSRTECAGIILVTVVSILCTPIGESVQLRSGYSVRASVSASAGSRDVTAVKARLEANWGQLPLRFEAIRSQVSSTEEFVARAQGYEVLLNGSEAILSVERPAASSPPLQSRQVARSRVGRHQRTERIAVRMQIVGANPAPRAEGLKRLESRSNYLIGSDPSKWLKNVPSYGQVRFQEVYPGIDLVYYGTEGRLEYDFVLSASRDPRIIRLRYPAAKSIHVDREGALVLRFDGTEIRQLKPNAYQSVAGAKRSVDARYVLRGDEVRFALGPYDPSQPLVIDPVLVYSTYFGGMGDEAAYGIAVDGGGNVYLTGTTTSTNLPTMGHAFPPFQSFLNGASGDVFVVKLNNTASSVIYATYIGGTAYDKGAAIAVDGAGNAYVGGTTSSSDFPTTAGASQPTYNGMVSTSNGFLLKLDSNGASLNYSTFLGGAGPDGVNNIFVDNSGIVFATGFTNSDSVFNPPGFPTTAGALQQNFGGSGDAFITKLSADGKTLFYSTYLGGSSDEEGQAIQVDGSGNAFVAGETESTDFPVTVGALQQTFPAKTLPASFSGWLAEINSTGTAESFGTFIGGDGNDFMQGLARDTSGNLFLTGFTTSNPGVANSGLFPITPGVFQPTYGGNGSLLEGDAFVMELNPTGTGVIYASYLGGSGDEVGADIKVDSAGFAYLTGTTDSSDFPVTPNASQGALAGIFNAFIAKVSPGGTQLVYSSLHGGNNSEGVGRLAVDASGFAYLSGATTSVSFPTTPGVIQPSNGGGYDDAFAAKFDLRAPTAVVTPAALAFNSQRVGTTSALQTITYSNIGNALLTITNISASSGFFQTNTCGALPALLSQGQACTVSASFQPMGSGAVSGLLTLRDDAIGSPRGVFLSGTGVAPVAALSAASLTFNSQNVGTISVPQNVMLTNMGTDTMNLTGISLGGANSSDFTQSNNCGATLASGANCSIVVSFRPTNLSLRTATITVADDSNAVLGSQQSVAVSGNGVAPPGGTFLLTTSAPWATMPAGQQAIYPLSVVPFAGFNQTVSLQCAGAPIRATCTVSPSSSTPNGVNTSSATLTILTTSNALLPNCPDFHTLPPWFFAICLIAIAVLSLERIMSARRPEPTLAFAILVLIVGSIFTVGCGVASAPPRMQGTPPGTYTIVVTGTGGGQTQSLNVNLVVQ